MDGILLLGFSSDSDGEKNISLLSILDGILLLLLSQASRLLLTGRKAGNCRLKYPLLPVVHLKAFLLSILDGILLLGINQGFKLPVVRLRAFLLSILDGILLGFSPLILTERKAGNCRLKYPLLPVVHLKAFLLSILDGWHTFPILGFSSDSDEKQGTVG